MSPPYRIVNKYYETIVGLDREASLSVAIKVAEGFRASAFCTGATVHGDNVDLGCADGLSREEREQVEEVLG